MQIGGTDNSGVREVHSLGGPFCGKAPAKLGRKGVMAKRITFKLVQVLAETFGYVVERRGKEYDLFSNEKMPGVEETDTLSGTYASLYSHLQNDGMLNENGGWTPAAKELLAKR